MRRAPLLSAGRLGPAGLDLARTPLGSRNGFRVVSPVKHVAGSRAVELPTGRAVALLSFLPIAGYQIFSDDRLIDAVDGQSRPALGADLPAARFQSRGVRSSRASAACPVPTEAKRAA